MEKADYEPKNSRCLLGATGSVGQRFVSLLDNHPWFQVVALAASDRSTGQPYARACRWVLLEPMPAWAREMTLLLAAPEAIEARIAFSALQGEHAQEVEPRFAQAGAVVCSNASTYRRDPDVPLLIPEVKPGTSPSSAANASSAAGVGPSSPTPTAPAPG
jgi:aspartate-semialdehyde dehydrogenase